MAVHIVWLCLLWLKSRLHLTSESVLLPFRTSASLITCGPKVNKTTPKTNYQFISIMTTIQKIKLLISYLVKEISRMIWFHNKINTLCRHFPPSIYLIIRFRGDIVSYTQPQCKNMYIAPNLAQTRKEI